MLQQIFNKIFFMMISFIITKISERCDVKLTQTDYLRLIFQEILLH